MAGTLCTLLSQSSRKQQSVFCCPQNFPINDAEGWCCLSVYKSVLNMHLISSVLEESTVWNEQYSLGVKTGTVLNPWRGKCSTEALSDLPEAMPWLHWDTKSWASAFRTFKQSDTEGVCDLPREKRTGCCFSLRLCRTEQRALSYAPPELCF